jgi:hypothetical protein
MQHRFDPALANNAIVAQDDDSGFVNFEQIFGRRCRGLRRLHRHAPLHRLEQRAAL